MSSEYLVPYWRDDPDYFPVKDARRSAHMAEDQAAPANRRHARCRGGGSILCGGGAEMHPCQCLNCDIQRLTDKVIRREFDMALEIKGLKGKALKAGGMFDRLNKAYDKLIETGDDHATDVEGLPSQIEGMADDLTFMVQTLGNSVNGSGEGGTKQPETEKTESMIKPGHVVADPPVIRDDGTLVAAPIAGDGRTFQRIG